MITLFQIWYTDKPMPELFKPFVADWKQWAENKGWNYFLHEPVSVSNQENRYNSDYERIKMAAQLAPCMYVDIDMRRVKDFEINPEYPQFGIPHIALFYLPDNKIPLEVLSECEKYMVNGIIPDSVICGIFHDKIIINDTFYEHYRYSKMLRKGQI